MSGGNIAKSVEQLSSDWQHDPTYYDNADSWVHIFWDKGSVFRRLFDRMNHARILEIACGRGRHTEQMRDWGNQKTAMDLVLANVEFCRNRFSDSPQITILQGNGQDLAFASDGSFSSVFCYDAMVHFDHTIIYSYLIEIARVLENGGMALLHHSNFGGNPGGDYKNNPHWRAYMPHGLFVDYCSKAGLVVIEQACIPWGEHPSSDMVSLVQKSPAQ